MLTTESTLGMSMRFDVVIDGYGLGSWTSCKGLGVSFKHEKVLELGEHTMVKYVPKQVEYPVITLQRALAKDDWNKTKEWLQFTASAPWMLLANPVADTAMDVAGAFGADTSIDDGGAPTGPTSGKITLLDSKLEEVATWELQNAMPNAWKGPTFDANGKGIAIETLEIVHEGFLLCLSA